MEQTSIIDLTALEAAPLNQDPFPFVVVPNLLHAEFTTEVARDFPKITDTGSFPLAELNGGRIFNQLTGELAGLALRNAIEQKFDLNLADRHTMITVRGMAGKHDGQIHTDTKSKFLTLLLYLNPTWEAEGGRLRILRNGRDLNDYVCEIPPLFGSCLIFKVTDNCWHGHKRWLGMRRSLQLNYIRDEASLNRHLLKHGLTAKLKSLKRIFTGNHHESMVDGVRSRQLCEF